MVYSVAISGIEPAWLMRRVTLEEDRRQEVENWRRSELNNSVQANNISIIQHNKQVNKNADRLTANIRDHVVFEMTRREKQELDRLIAGLQALIDGGRRK